MLILQTLRWGPRHGYAISQAIRSGSEDFFQIETGSLYPALQRLEQRGLVDADWKVTDHNQRAKVYRFTASGRKHLDREQSHWQRVVDAVATMMRTKEGH